jgi:hypothetical protein
MIALAIAVVGLPLALGVAVPAGGGWTGLVVALLLLAGGFLVSPVRTIAVFAAVMVGIASITPIAGERLSLLDELFVPIAVALTVARRWRAIPSRMVLVRDAAVAVLVVAAVASSLANGVPAGIWVPGLSLLVKGIAIFYVVRLHDVTAGDVRWTLRLYLVLSVAVLVLGFGQLILLALGGPADGASRGGIPVVSSLFHHPQLFGWMCATAALYLIAHNVLLGRRWMLALALLFSVGTILSGRRKSIIALGGGLVAGAAADIGLRLGAGARARRWAASGIGVAVVAVLFLPAFSSLYDLTIRDYVAPIVADPGGGPAGGIDDEPAAGTPARIALYETAVRIGMDEFPLGVGLGRYASWVSRIEYSEVYQRYGLDTIYGLSPANPMFINDTFWPQILGETGVVGLAAYGVLVAWFGLAMLRLVRRSDLPPATAAVVLGTSMLLVQTLVESLVSTILGSPSQAYVVMLALGGTLSWVAAIDARAPGATDDAGLAGPDAVTVVPGPGGAALEAAKGGPPARPPGSRA